MPEVPTLRLRVAIGALMRCFVEQVNTPGNHGNRTLNKRGLLSHPVWQSHRVSASVPPKAK